MIKDILIKFHNDLQNFDETQPIVVALQNGDLIYRQYSKLVIATYLNPFFFRKPGFKYGILTQFGYNRLITDLVKLIQDRRLDEQELLIAPGDNMSIYGYVTFKDNRLQGPQRLYDLKLVNITNKLYANFLLKRYSPETRMIYNILKAEAKKDK